MEMRFCRRCGEPLYKNKSVPFYECSFGHYEFLSPRPTVSIFFVDGDSVVVSRRAIDPGKGTLGGIGGFIDPDETIEDALAREISEETNLAPEEYSEPIYFGSAINSYSYQEQIIPVISSLYWATLKTTKKLVAGDDIAGLERVDLDSIDPKMFGMEGMRTGITKLQTLWRNNELAS